MHKIKLLGNGRITSTNQHFPNLLVCLPVLSLERKGFQQHETKLKILPARKSTHGTKDSIVKYICYCPEVPPGKPRVLQVRVSRKSSKRQLFIHLSFVYSKASYYKGLKSKTLWVHSTCLSVPPHFISHNGIMWEITHLLSHY